jgi:hypothetical protein
MVNFSLAHQSKLLTRDEARRIAECFFYSHGKYRHCAPVTSMPPLSISDREEGTAAISGREEDRGTAAIAGRGVGTGTSASEGRECTATVPNVQQWLVPTQQDAPWETWHVPRLSSCKLASHKPVTA